MIKNKFVLVMGISLAFGKVLKPLSSKVKTDHSFDKSLVIDSAKIYFSLYM